MEAEMFTTFLQILFSLRCQTLLTYFLLPLSQLSSFYLSGHRGSVVASVVLLEQVKGFAKAPNCSHELGNPCLSSFWLCGEKDLRERRLIDSAPRLSEVDRRKVLRGIHRSLWFLNFVELSHLGDFLLVHVLHLTFSPGIPILGYHGERLCHGG